MQLLLTAVARNTWPYPVICNLWWSWCAFKEMCAPFAFCYVGVALVTHLHMDVCVVTLIAYSFELFHNCYILFMICPYKRIAHDYQVEVRQVYVSCPHQIYLTSNNMYKLKFGKFMYPVHIRFTWLPLIYMYKLKFGKFMYPIHIRFTWLPLIYMYKLKFGKFMYPVHIRFTWLPTLYTLMRAGGGNVEISAIFYW